MLRIHSFLQGIYSYIKSLSKRTYRTCAVVMTGTMVVSVVSLSSSGFGGSGKNRVLAFQSQNLIEEEKDEEVEADAKAKVQTISDGQELETKLIKATTENEQSGQVTQDTTVSEKKKDKQPARQSIFQTAAIRQELFLVMANVSLSDQTVEYVERTVSVEKMSAEENLTESAEEFAENTQEKNEVLSNAVSSNAQYNSFAANYQASEDEYAVLLHIVAAEAGGCDSVGQILVANAILNRVESERFPNTITGVVYQKNQFAPVVNGVLWNSKVSDTVRDSVDRALAGEDYSKGALFFSAPAMLDDDSMSWFDNNLLYMFSHDGHRFYTFRN